MNRQFGATSTTDEVLEGKDLSGKRVLVTGVSAGLGVETARALASRGARVVGAARDLGLGGCGRGSRRRGRSVLRELSLLTPPTNVEARRPGPLATWQFSFLFHVASEVLHEINTIEECDGGTGCARCKGQRPLAAAVSALLHIGVAHLDGLSRAQVRAGRKGRVRRDLDNFL
jgi:hypothetical protein